jgi:acetate kinase
MSLLLLNAGSSGLKASLVERGTGALLWTGSADLAGREPALVIRRDGVERIVSAAGVDRSGAASHLIRDALADGGANAGTDGKVRAVGHRFVHGGPFTESTIVTREVRARIEALSSLAPLHNPPSLEVLEVAERELPDVPQIAVFDTAFHASIPEAARTYPVPAAWTRDWGLRKYGFHGLSYAYCVPRAAELLGRPVAELCMIVCHLGQGASVAAVDRGVCVDTSMGFTPLDGLMMGTRCGAVDPGLLLDVLRRPGMTVERVERELTRESGLLGVSGHSSDMREVLAAAERGHEPSRLAIDIYCRRIRQTVGAYCATLGGIDALVFAGGVGEHAPEIRRRACDGLECLGVRLDESANQTEIADGVVSSTASRVAVLVVATREEVTLRREVERLLDRTA